MRISRNVIVAGYPLGKALTRVRALRSDGAESLLSMCVALLYLADVRTGFVGKPRQGGGRWHRYSLKDLAQLAYGGQTPAEERRADRAIDMMVSLGWAFPTKQVRRHKKDAEGGDLWCSEAGVRRLNFQRLCDMVGTSWLLKRDRKHADQARGTGTRYRRCVFYAGTGTPSAGPGAGRQAAHGQYPSSGTSRHGRPTRRRAERRAAHLRHPRPVQIAVAGRLAPASCRKNRHPRRQICRTQAG